MFESTMSWLCSAVLSNEKAFLNINIYLFNLGPCTNNLTIDSGFTSRARSGQANGLTTLAEFIYPEIAQKWFLGK